MDEQRYHDPDDEPVGEGHQNREPEGWSWVVPGSTPSPGRGRAPGPGEGSPPESRPEEDASRWGASPEPPNRPSGWGASTGAEAAGTERREWWGDDPEPFTVETARRLSPRSMVVGPVNQLRSLLLPILVGLFIGGFNPWVLAATAAAIVSLLIGGFVTWRTLRYEITDDRIEIRKGLLRRERRTIPLERIRGVDVTSTVLHRMLGVTVVRIEAAAGSVAAEDGKLDAVDVVEADRLRRELLRRKAELTGREDAPARAVGESQEESVGPDTAQDVPEDVVHFTMPRSWYLYGALSLAYLLTPFAVLATLVGLVQQSAGEVATNTAVDWVTGTERGLLLTFAIGTIVVLVLLMPVFAVISYAFAHWGFTLKARDGSLIAERGLFTRRSVTLEKRRIRGHELLDNPLERLRDVVHLRAVVTGLGDAATRAVLLPTGPRSVVSAVVDETLTGYRGGLRRHPRAALGRRLVRSVLPFLAVAVAAAVLGWTWVALVAGAMALLGVPLGVDRYRSLGHGDDGERVSVRSGSLQRSQAVVEHSAVIGWTWTQTLFQRRSGLADLQVTVGAGAGGYTAQDAALSESVAFAAGVTPRMVRPFLVAPGAGNGRGGTEGADPAGPAPGSTTRPSSNRT